MSKFQKLLRAFSLLIRKPSLINKIIDAPEIKQKEIKKKYQLENGLRTIQITDLIPNLNETVMPFSFLDGGSTPIDLMLLKSLAKRFNECDYFEIGTWRGESVSNVASVAKHCTTLNLPDKDMLTMGLSERYVNAHRFFSDNLRNVTHIQANSLSFNYAELHKKFDLIFIDGDHHYESVKTDTQNAFNLLKNDASIIIWHDYGNNPTDVRWDVLKGILDGTPQDKKQYLYHVSNTLCAIYTTEKIISSYVPLYSSPSTLFSVNIKASSLKAIT